MLSAELDVNAPQAPLLVRAARSADLPQLSQLYATTVRAIGPQGYSPAQVERWAAFADEAGFAEFILRAATYVAEDASGLLGFGGLAADGRVTALYVRADRCRQGIGARLLGRLLDEARCQGLARLYAEASEFSRPLFERFGFRQYATETVDRGGVQFVRYLVEWLAPPATQDSPAATEYPTT